MEKNQNATGITLSFRLSEAIHWTTKRMEKNACPTNPTDSQNCSLLIVPLLLHGLRAPPRRRAQAHHRSGPDVADGLGAADRADHAGGSGVAAAVDLQKRPALGHRTDPTGPSHEPSDGRRAAPATRLQPAGQS